MKVYQVIFESENNDNEVIDVVEYVQSSDFKKVADAMTQRAEELGHELKSIKYILTIVET